MVNNNRIISHKNAGWFGTGNGWLCIYECFTIHILTCWEDDAGNDWLWEWLAEADEDSGSVVVVAVFSSGKWSALLLIVVWYDAPINEIWKINKI
jgi:hypothetical protein